jgi:polysaccharide export outer membrane protein
VCSVDSRLRGVSLFTVIAVLWLMNAPSVAVCQESSPAQPPPHALSSYILGPGDQLTFSGLSADEIANRPFRIDADGEVNLPMVGRLPASGLTLRQFETELNKQLSVYIREPRVVATITEFRSQPVSVVGAVKTPGTHQLEGQKNLMEMIAMAGGFREDAGNVITITRELQWGTIPLPGAVTDASEKFSLAQVNIRQILAGKDPASNISIMPRDVISVPKAELVYVVGGVAKAGGFVLSERESMSVLQALSLAEGLDRFADSKHAKVLRLQSDQVQRVEIAVDLRKILDGTSKDIALQGGDILFVPDNNARRVRERTMEAIVQAAVGAAIWRP